MKLEAIEADLLKERENVRLLQSMKQDKEGEMLAIKSVDSFRYLTNPISSLMFSQYSDTN